MKSGKMFAEIKAALNRISIDFGGGCNLHKAPVMAWLIKQFGLTTSLDIGVYRGRSLFRRRSPVTMPLVEWFMVWILETDIPPTLGLV